MTTLSSNDPCARAAKLLPALLLLACAEHAAPPTTRASSGSGTGGMPVAEAGHANAAGHAAGGLTGGGATLVDASGAGGSADAAGAAGSGPDAVSTRPLNVNAEPARYEHQFLASAADSDVTFNDDIERAIFDNRAKKLMGKLVLVFGGAGNTDGHIGGTGEFCARRGFHVLAVAAFQNYDIGSGDQNFYGDARRQVFDGVEHTAQGDFANVHMLRADGVAQRAASGLAHLQTEYPGEDWGYYLEADGSVRWSDVIFTGISHGASNAARFAMLVRVWRAVSIAGPRDNSCPGPDLPCEPGRIATWLDERPATPIERFFGITGRFDEQHPQQLFAMQRLGFSGTPRDVVIEQPPYADSHRLVVELGHDEVCDKPEYQAACNYAFGVPPENQPGVF